MAPRFMLVLGHEVNGQLAPAWPGAGREAGGGLGDGLWVAWRLLGSNHRELARSASVYLTADAACAAIRRLQEHVDAATVATAAVNGRWDWQLSVEGELLAVASRLYQRPRECLYNLDVALAAIRTATLADVTPRMHGASASGASIDLDTV